MRTILDRRVDPPVARVVKTYDLARALAQVRIPGLPELDMWARWCMPVRADGELLGLLWVLDPDNRVSRTAWPAIVDCAAQAAEVLARAEVSRPGHRAAAGPAPARPAARSRFGCGGRVDHPRAAASRGGRSWSTASWSPYPGSSSGWTCRDHTVGAA